MEDLERQAARGRESFRIADTEFKRLRDAVGWTVAVEKDTRMKVDAALEEVKVKVQTMGAGIAEVNRKAGYLDQERAKMEQEIQTQRAGIDELYVGAKTKMEEMDGLLARMASHINTNGIGISHQDWIGMQSTVEARIIQIEEKIRIGSDTGHGWSQQ